MLRTMLSMIGTIVTVSCAQTQAGFPQYDINLAGQVADDASRAPIANASLAISCLDDTSFHTIAKSDATGQFRISYGFEWEVRYVAVLLRVRATGYSETTLSNHLLPNDGDFNKTDYVVLLKRCVMP